MMLLLLLFLAILSALLWVGYILTGALFLSLFWLLFKVPAALIMLALALVCCCTLILIPVGIVLFKIGIRLLIPGL